MLRGAGNSAGGLATGLRAGGGWRYLLAWRSGHTTRRYLAALVADAIHFGQGSCFDALRKRSLGGGGGGTAVRLLDTLFLKRHRFNAPQSLSTTESLSADGETLRSEGRDCQG